MNNLHPTMARALAPFAPPPLRWYRVKHTDAAGKTHQFCAQYINVADAFDVNLKKGLCGLNVHPLTDAEAEAYELNLAKSERFHDANDRRALDLQIDANPGQWL